MFRRYLKIGGHRKNRSKKHVTSTYVILQIMEVVEISCRQEKTFEKIVAGNKSSETDSS